MVRTSVVLGCMRSQRALVARLEQAWDWGGFRPHWQPWQLMWADVVSWKTEGSRVHQRFGEGPDRRALIEITQADSEGVW